MSKMDDGKIDGSIVCPKCKNRAVKVFFADRNPHYRCGNCGHSWENKTVKESKFELYLAEAETRDTEENNEAYTKAELAKKLKVDPSEIKTNSIKGKMDLWIVDGKTYKKK